MGALDDLIAQTESKPKTSAIDSLMAHYGEEKPFGWQDTWPARLAKGFYNAASDAATLPGDVYSGKQQIDDPALTGRALNFSLLASPAPVGKLGWAPAGVKAPSEKELFSAGEKGYDFARGSKVALRGDMMAPWARMIQSKLNRKGFFDTPNNAPTTFAILKKLEQDSGGGAFLTAGNYINLRQALQKQAQSGGAESAAATVVLKRLDELFDKAPQTAFVAGTPAEISGIRAAIKDARSNFAAGFRSREITGRERAAELRSEAANSGKNFDNSARQRLAGLILKEEKSPTGYTPGELAATEKVVEGSFLRNRARSISNKMGGGGGLGAAMWALPGLGYGVGTRQWGPLLYSMGIPAAGAAIKGAENLLTKRDIRKLDNMIRLRSAEGARAEAKAANAPKPPPLPYASQQAYKLFLDYLGQHPNES